MTRRVLKTKLCDMLDIEYPILSAGMGPSLIGERTGAPVELVAAVSEAGGLGVLGGAGFTVEEMREHIREIKKLTDKPFGVDILLPPALVRAGDEEFTEPKETPLQEIVDQLPKEHRDFIMNVKEELGLPDIDASVRTGSTTMRPHAAVKVIIEEKVPLFCAGLGNPKFMVEDAHRAGVKVLGIAGHTRNAKRIADGGADIVVAQGGEGGGHTGLVGSMAFWPQAVDACAPTMVLGAGGIGDGRGLVAALALGCAGVWVGTRFLATKEGGTIPAQREAILAARDEDSRRSQLYTGKPSRAPGNRFHALWEKSGLDPLPFPIQVTFSSALVNMFEQAEMTEYISPFSGQISGMIDEIKPAAQVVEEMVEEAVEILGRTLPANVEFA
jgi:NAD(P)H-dependent flavin oxidoreductase YrpB (nitropropane dioxygenase family)